MKPAQDILPKDGIVTAILTPIGAKSSSDSDGEIGVWEPMRSTIIWLWVNIGAAFWMCETSGGWWSFTFACVFRQHLPPQEWRAEQENYNLLLQLQMGRTWCTWTPTQWQIKRSAKCSSEFFDGSGRYGVLSTMTSCLKGASIISLRFHLLLVKSQVAVTGG